MLVTLGTNQAISAGGSWTGTYSPTSLQKVLIRIEDADSLSGNTQVTVQVGSVTICNGAIANGLMGYSLLQSGTSQATNDMFLELDFGSWECVNNDNIYVTLYNAGAIDAVDVSCIVDEPGLGRPVRLTEYSDNTFTSENCILALSYDVALATVDEDAYNIEVRSALSSSSPSLISANSYFRSRTNGDNYNDKFGIVYASPIPYRTTFNYSSSAVTDRILTVEQVGVNRAQVNQGRRTGRLARTMMSK